MRTFLNGSGTDVTSTVVSYLAANEEFRFADLYLIGEPEDPLAVYLTDWETTLTWSPWGQFQQTAIKRAAITSQIGLAVDTLDVEWSPLLTAFGTSLATANFYQKAISGFFDNKTFRLWRTVMPTAGDANTYGACELFGGRIGQTVVVRDKITFTVNSFLDVINQSVPPNVIDLNNTLANFAGNTPVVSDSESAMPQFTVHNPTAGTGGNPTVDIVATCTGPTPNKVYGGNKFIKGFMVFNQGSSLAGYWSPIASNGGYKYGNPPAGTNYNHFLVYAAFPWAPTPGDTFYCSVKPPINLADAVAGFAYYGFPYVPQPETAA